MGLAGAWHMRIPAKSWVKKGESEFRPLRVRDVTLPLAIAIELVNGQVAIGSYSHQTSRRQS